MAETSALNYPIRVSGAVKEPEASERFLLKLQLTAARKKKGVTSQKPVIFRATTVTASDLTDNYNRFYISVLKRESLRHPNTTRQQTGTYRAVLIDLDGTKFV